MFKRLLFAGLALVAPFTTLWLIFFTLDDIFKAEFRIPDWFQYVAFLISVSGIPAAIYTFLKVKPKNTMIEDIIVNQVKIMKAKQEAKLKELQGGK